MRRSLKLKWMSVVLFVAVAGFFLIGPRPVTDNESGSRATRSAVIDSERNNHSGGLEPEARPSSQTETLGGNSQPCLTAAQLESHPSLIQDSYRFDAVSDTGPSIASYRGLTEHELLGLAIQGDSAAMVVLGAMSVMRAREWPVEKAATYLTLEDPALMAYKFERPLSKEFLDHMARARKWYYDAALHGRVMVLHRVGDSLSLEKGGAVELGWIDAAEYDSLSRYEKTALIPSNVYNVLSFEVAPGLKSGPLGELIADLMPRSERQRTIVDRLAEQFFLDQVDAGLDPVSIPQSTAPPIEDLLRLLCESELDRLKSGGEDIRLWPY